MQPICSNLDLETRTIMEERCQEKALNAGDVDNGDTGKETPCARHHLASGIPVLLKGSEKGRWRRATRPRSNPLEEEKGAIGQ